MRILTAADRWCGVRYGHPASRYDDTVVDCSTLTAHVLDAVLPGGLPTAAWLDVVVADGRRPWSPIERAVRDGWGDPLPTGATGPVWTGWYLLQAWRDIPTSGHAMLVWFGVADYAVLEATNAKAPDGAAFGVRWRGAGQRAVAPLSVEGAPRLTPDALVEAYPAGLRWARLVGVE
jgi:hypothetical protein